MMRRRGGGALRLRLLLVAVLAAVVPRGRTLSHPGLLQARRWGVLGHRVQGTNVGNVGLGYGHGLREPGLLRRWVKAGRRPADRDASYRARKKGAEGAKPAKPGRKPTRRRKSTKTFAKAKAQSGDGAEGWVYDPSQIGSDVPLQRDPNRPLQSLQSINDHVEQLLRKKTGRNRNGVEQAPDGGANGFPDPSALAASQDAQRGAEANGVHHDSSDFHVVLCFGKRLVRDQVTLEYASRIRTLVRYLRRLKESRQRGPDIVCFTGGYMGASCISSASAGYMFFRQMAECAGVDISHGHVLLEEESHVSREALDLVVAEVSEAAVRAGQLPGQTVHYTLISTTQHVRRIEYVHEHSHPSSMLRSIEEAGGSFSLLKASNPFLSSPDESLSFLAHLMLVVEELVPIRVNFQGAAAGVDFIRRENLSKLVTAKQSLNELIADLGDPIKLPHAQRYHNPTSKNPLFESAARKLLLGDGTALNVEEELESAAASLSRVKDMVQPAKNFQSHMVDFAAAADVLGEVIDRLRLVFDPDRPLQLNEMMGLMCEQWKARGSR